jgi:hypothetical protein
MPMKASTQSARISKIIMTKFIKHLAVGVVAIGSALSIQADPAEYIFTGTASGSLDGSRFFGDAFQFDFFGDASDSSTAEFGSGVYSINSGLTATVTIFGVGSDTLSSTLLYVFNNQNFSVAGFGTEDAFDFLDIGPNAAFTTYDLTSSLGPIAAPVAFSGDYSLQTAGGSLLLDRVSGTAFQAIVESQGVPDGGMTMALLGAGFSALVGFGRRFR